MSSFSQASYSLPFWSVKDHQISDLRLSKRKRQEEESHCVQQETALQPLLSFENDRSQPQKRQKSIIPTSSQTKTTPSKFTHVMNKKDLKWFAMLEQLEIYRRQHGDCVVPRGYAPNKQLASWVAEQRKQYKLMRDGKQSNITAERVSLLHKIGFIWSAQESAWNKQLHALIAYKANFGHCLVPVHNPDCPHLGAWVKEQRRHYALKKQGKRSHMTQERINALEKVGFCWDSHEASWWEKFRELETYHQVHGHSNVPTKSRTNPQLGTWVHHQRRQYKASGGAPSSRLTKERMEALNRIGFCWLPRSISGFRRSTERSWEVEGHEEESTISSSSLLSSSSPSTSSSSSYDSLSSDNDDTSSIASDDDTATDECWNEWDEEFNERNKTYFMELSNETETSASVEVQPTPYFAASNFEHLLDEKVQKLEDLLFGLTEV